MVNHSEIGLTTIRNDWTYPKLNLSDVVQIQSAVRHNSCLPHVSKYWICSDNFSTSVNSGPVKNQYPKWSENVFKMNQPRTYLSIIHFFIKYFLHFVSTTCWYWFFRSFSHFSYVELCSPVFTELLWGQTKWNSY